MKTALFHNDLAESGSQPWIHQWHSRTHEIFNIASDDCQTMNHRRRGDQSIDIRQFPSRTQSSPNLCFLAADPKNTSFEDRRDFCKRAFIGFGFCGTFCPDLLHASAYFANGQSTHEVGLGRVIPKPRSHFSIRTATLLDFTNHVGIQQEISHSSRSGRFSYANSKLTSILGLRRWICRPTASCSLTSLRDRPRSERPPPVLRRSESDCSRTCQRIGPT